MGVGPKQKEKEETRWLSAAVLTVAGSPGKAIISSGQVFVVLGGTKTDQAPYC